MGALCLLIGETKRGKHNNLLLIALDLLGELLIQLGLTLELRAKSTYLFNNCS